ncbi:MAG: carboxylating nicotinate-nucleotide diphosphorylase [Dehalococcoidia bacterium]|jgi:nicotinate-nucleotide pyrophosphorylase (carboxylating)
MVSTQQPIAKEIDTIIDLALEEDVGQGDITSESLIPTELTGKAIILVKETGVLAGIEIAERVFQRIDPSLETEILITDGAPVKPGDICGVISGNLIGILKTERVALNFLQRLSGIATLTARYVAEVRGTTAGIYDTRKTTPGMRFLEKYAVRMGGGQNHRQHLGDAVLIKDNHIAALRSTGMTLVQIVERARENAPEGIVIEVEVTTPEEAGDASHAGADIILLDNMSIGGMKKVVDMLGGRVKLEASGGITLDNVRDVAMTGVDRISIGALTHSFTALDISLEIESSTLKLL